MFSWWWQTQDAKLDKSNNASHIQSLILNKLDECHANEVVLVFKSIRDHRPAIVSLLQEQMLDKGVHNRLVTLLAHMYQ